MTGACAGVPKCATVRDVSDPTAQQPAPPAPATPAAQPPPQQPAASAQPQQNAAPVTNVTVNLPPDLLRMAGLSAQSQPAAQSGTPPAPAAQPATPPTPPPAAAAPAQPAAVEAPKPIEPAKPAEPSADVTALQAQLSELKAQQRATLIRAEVDRVSLTGGAINAADVLKLVADELDVAADGRVIAKGDPRVTGEQHVARFLAARPHMLKPQVQGGGAGAPSTVTPPTAPATPKPDMSTNEGATALAKKIAEARGFARPSTAA